MKTHKKKYSFILLETLIALTLVVLIAIPIISSALLQCTTQLSDLRSLELKKVINQTISEALEGLYNNNPSWQEITRNGPKTNSPIRTYHLSIDGKPFEIKRYYKIKCVENKKFFSQNHKDEYRLLEIVVCLEPTKQTNSFFRKKTISHFVMAINI